MEGLVGAAESLIKVSRLGTTAATVPLSAILPPEVGPIQLIWVNESTRAAL